MYWITMFPCLGRKSSTNPLFGTMSHVLFAVALLLTPVAYAEPLIGRASVVDADTLDLAGERVRLNGIDAPETAQLCRDAADAEYRCGQQASIALDDWLAKSRPTRCEFIERDRYDRFVGRCFRADGAELQEWLVRQGHAVDWPQYSGGAYAAAQADAKRNERGIWAGEFTLPWEWRRGKRMGAESSPLAEREAAPSPDCRIKGNISRNGQIFHVPGQEHYERTQIDESAGERWFCTPEEAKAAGWRAAQR